MQRGGGLNHLPDLTPGLKKVKSYTSTPHPGFHGLLWEQFSFSFGQEDKLGIINSAHYSYNQSNSLTNGTMRLQLYISFKKSYMFLRIPRLAFVE